jgi:hypothetical protein
MEPSAFPENTYGYGAQLMFKDGELDAVYLRDDYESWTDCDAGITGSNLADVNRKDVEWETSFQEFLEGYLKDSVEWFTVIHSNDVDACRKFLDQIEFSDEDLDPSIWTIQTPTIDENTQQYLWTTERIKLVAMNMYAAYLDEYGDVE